MKTLYNFFKSVRLAVVLIACITLLSMLTAVIPQGKEADYYFSAFPRPVASFIVFMNVHNLFRSVLFLFPVCIFFVNLCICTVDRIVRRIRTRAKFKPGPDIIHIGLLVLIAAGLVSFINRHEEYISLRADDTWRLGNDIDIIAGNFEFLRYPDGRPKEWIVHAIVKRNNAVVRDNAEIRINQPFDFDGFSVYLVSYGTDVTCVFTNGMTLVTGDMMFENDTICILRDGNEINSATSAVFEIIPQNGKAEEKEFAAGNTICGSVIESVSVKYYPRLKAVSDPGLPFIFIAFILIAAGLSITYIQKLTEKKT